MDFRAIELSLNKFAANDESLLQGLLTETSKKRPSVFNNRSAGEVLTMLENHRTEHGISIGYINDGYGHVLGLAGLHYLPETGIYEIVSHLLPDHAGRTAAVIEYLVFEAFANLGMDKICARVLPESTDASILKENGFTCLGERAFAEEGMGQIWQYYELENEGTMAAPAQDTAYATSDWDSLF